MRTTTTSALLALMLLSPLAANPADLTVGLQGAVEYDDNALRQNNQEDDDVLFRIRPEVKLHEDRGQDLNWFLSYAVPFEFAVENGEELDDIDHIARGRADYRVNERLSFFVADDFRYLRSALREVAVDDILAGDDTLLVNQERDRVTLNDASAGASFRFTPRLSADLGVSHDLFASERSDRADNWQVEGTGSLNYLVTPKHQVGLGLRVLHLDIEDRDAFPGSTTNSYNLFAQWTWRFSETLQLQIAAGPTLIDSDQDDPKASVVTADIPSLTLAAGSNPNALGLVNPDGTPAPTVANPGSLVVSQIATCPQVTGTVTTVFTGNVCPIPSAGSATPTTAGVYIDGLNGPLVSAVTNQTPQTDPFAEGESETRIDVFGLAVIRKDWTENLHSALRYERTQAGASGLGGAVIADSASLATTWDFAERWQASVRGDWILRRSIIENSVSQFLVATDASGLSAAFSGTAPAGVSGLATIRGGNSNEIETMRYGIAGQMTHRFTRNTSGWVRLTYNEQTSDGGTRGNVSDFENFLAVLGVRHVFEPIKLW